MVHITSCGHRLPNALGVQREAGDKAPAFTLKADDGKEVSLADLKGKAVVVYFYPRAMTPGCTLETQDFRDLKSQFDSSGAVPKLVISYETNPPDTTSVAQDETEAQFSGTMPPGDAPAAVPLGLSAITSPPPKIL